MFCVVEFIEDQSTAVVPSGWLLEDLKTCRWPPVRQMSAVDRMVTKNCAPDSTWIQYQIRILYTTGLILYNCYT
jgi:hypothetical protein